MLTGMRTTTRLGWALRDAADSHDLLPTHVMRRAGSRAEQVSMLERDGIIERIIRGLYRLAGTQSPLQDIAAALQRHRDGVASHTSALFVHGLEVVPPDVPHITLPPGSTSRSRLATMHRSPIGRIDRTRRQGLPVTTVARSIVDAAELLREELLAAVVNEAVTRRLVLVPHIVDAALRVEAAPGRKGSGRLRAVLRSWTEPIRPDSVAEAAAIRRIRTFGLPAPVTQHVVTGADGSFVARVDLAWPSQKIAREYQSVKWHRPDRIEPDEIRLQHLEALGWEVEPLFRHDLLPSEVDWLRRLASQLGSRSAAS